MSRNTLDRALRTLAILACVVMVGLATFVPLHTNDFWLQAKVGQLIVEEGRIPHTLLFPFTWAANERFNVHEALPSVVFYLLDHWLGYDHLLFVKGALGLLLLGLLSHACWRLSGRPALALALAAMGMACMNYRFVMRPELFALFTMLGTLVLCTRVRDGAPRAWLAWTLPMQLVWANSHGSFILGPGVAFLFAAGEAIDGFRRGGLRTGWQAGWPFAALGAVLLAVSIANPLGVDLLLFPFQLSGSGVVERFIFEWRSPFSPPFPGEPGFWLVLATALAGLVVAAWRWRALRASDAILLLVFTVMAGLRVRHGVWLGLVVPVVAAGLLRRPAGGPDPSERGLLATVLAVCAGGIALLLQFGNAYYAFPYFTPSNNMTEQMREQLASPQVKGNVFVSMELGAELIYRAWPRLKPSFDSRVDSYGDGYVLMYLEMMSHEEKLKPFLDEFDVRYMLLLRRDFEPNVSRFEGLRQAGWRIQFADHKMVLLRLP